MNYLIEMSGNFGVIVASGTYSEMEKEADKHLFDAPESVTYLNVTEESLPKLFHEHSDGTLEQIGIYS